MTARILQRYACIPFIPDSPVVLPTSSNHCPSVRELDRCRIRQMVSKFMVKYTDSLQLAHNGRKVLIDFLPETLFRASRKVRIWLRKQCRLLCHQFRSCRVIEFGSKTFMSFKKVQRAAKFLVITEMLPALTSTAPFYLPLPPLPNNIPALKSSSHHNHSR